MPRRWAMATQEAILAAQDRRRKPTGTGGVPKDPSGAQAILMASKPIQQRKYRNQPTVVDGVTFDSKREAERYAELRFMVRTGVVRDLEVHPRFPLVVHGQDCGVYEADFAWIDPETGERVVEDVKSAATRKLPTYRLKARLLWALYGLRVQEV